MPSFRVICSATVLGVLAPAVVLTAAAPALAATTCTVFFDVDKDLVNTNTDDLVVGTPSEDVGSAADAGTVTIVYGDSAGVFGQTDGQSLSQADLSLTPETGDRFGASLLTADLNGDGCGDLVVGAPGEDAGAGIVVVVYGQPKDTAAFGSNIQVLKQGANGVSGAAEAGDGFGSSLAVTGGTAADGPTQLWVGAPGEDLGTTKDAGTAVVFPTLTGSFLPQTGITYRRQATNGFSGTAEAGDRFGTALAGSATTVLVGVPGEDLSGKVDAGMVHAVVNGAPATFHQNTLGVPGLAESGDQFGSTLAIWSSCMDGAEAWALGAPLENVGSNAVDAGFVALLDRGTGTALSLQQGVNSIPGAAEAGDQFGASMVGTGVATNRGDPFLAIGSGREDIGSVTDAGSVTTLSTNCPGGALATASVQAWTQSTPGVPGDLGAGDRFGNSLGASLILEGPPVSGIVAYRLVIGVSGEDEPTENGPLVNSGMVTVLPSTPTGFGTNANSFFGQNTELIPGAGESNDAFGSSLDSANANR